MASLYFANKKSPKDEARKELIKYVRNVCDLEHMVCFASDDGGTHIVIYVEVEVPADPLPSFLRESLHHSKWMGWRQMVIKCPIGSIGTTIPIRD
jgi:hypothetical protein